MEFPVSKIFIGEGESFEVNMKVMDPFLHRDCERDIAIGNLIFEKYVTVFGIYKSGGGSLGFVEEFKLIEKDKNLWIVLVILGLFTLVVFGAYIAIGMGKKDKNKFLE